MVIVEYIKEAINENVLEDSEDPINQIINKLQLSGSEEKYQLDYLELHGYGKKKAAVKKAAVKKAPETKAQKPAEDK